MYLEECLVNPPAFGNWVNGNLYVATTEVAGVLPVPPKIRELSGMASFNPTLDFQQSHAYLASLQGTQKPILPVHSSKEYQLFQTLLRENSAFNSPSGPNWKQAVKAWNHVADQTDGIFYKVRHTFQQLVVTKGYILLIALII